MVDVAIDAEPAPERSAHASRPVRSRARRRALTAAAALTVVVGLGVAQCVEQRARDEREARFAAMPGTVGSLDRPLEESWAVGGVSGVTRVGALALVTLGDEHAVHAVDVADGRVAWALEAGGPASADRCLGDRGSRADVIVCHRGRSDGGAPGTVTVVVVDAVDGTVLAEYPSHLPSHGAVMAGDELVTVQQRDGLLDVRRTDPVTRQDAWAARVGLAGGRQGGDGAGRVRVENGLVVVQGATTAVLDAVDGRVLGVWHAGGYTPALQPTLDGAEVRTAPSGYAVWSRAAAGRRETTGTWFDRSGRPVSTIDGVLVEPGVSDGSAPDVVLSARPDTGELVATDVTRGRELWRARDVVGHVLVRRDGAALVAGSGTLAAVDVATGATRWRTAVPGVVGEAGMVTDGSTLVVVAERAGRARLVAVRLDDGVVRWEGPVPDGVPPLSARDHDLLHVRLGEVSGHVVLLADRLVAGMR